MINYNEIDEDIRELVRAMNNIEGIQTTSSCSGHGVSPCVIHFKCSNIHYLHSLLFNHFNTVKTWYIQVDNADVNVKWDSIPLALCSRHPVNKENIDLMTANFVNLVDLREVQEI